MPGLCWANKAELPNVHGFSSKSMTQNTQALVKGAIVTSEGFPCGSISSLGALGEGSSWDLRVCPAPAVPAASGNLGFCPLGIEVEKQGFRTASKPWLITGQKIQGVGLKLTAFILAFRVPFMSTNHDNG